MSGGLLDPHGNALEDFEILSEIAKTSRGSVYKVVSKKTGEMLCLKQRTSTELGRSGDIAHEYKIFQTLEHPHIIRCFGSFMSRSSFYIILELCQGDLQQEVERRRSQNAYWSEAAIWMQFRQIVSAVAYLHSRNIIHRDLKTSNIFVAKDGALKLGDFGVSRCLADPADVVATFYGTPLYLSPELCEHSAYNQKTDIWALGVILYELASLSHPFKGASLAQIVRAITGGSVEPLPARYSPTLRAIDAQLLQRDPAQRPTAATLLSLVEEATRVAGCPAAPTPPNQASPPCVDTNHSWGKVSSPSIRADPLEARSVSMTLRHTGRGQSNVDAVVPIGSPNSPSTESSGSLSSGNLHMSVQHEQENPLPLHGPFKPGVLVAALPACRRRASNMQSPPPSPLRGVAGTPASPGMVGEGLACLPPRIPPAGSPSVFEPALTLGVASGELHIDEQGRRVVRVRSKKAGQSVEASSPGSSQAHTAADETNPASKGVIAIPVGRRTHSPNSVAAASSPCDGPVVTPKRRVMRLSPAASRLLAEAAIGTGMPPSPPALSAGGRNGCATSSPLATPPVPTAGFTRADNNETIALSPGEDRRGKLPIRLAIFHRPSPAQPS